MVAEFVQQGGPVGIPIIQGYAPGGWRVSGQLWAGAVLVMPGGARALAGISEADLAGVTSDYVEVLLVGTGPAMTRPDLALMALLLARGVSAEYMDSKAAARTYNVLANEGRRVAAALLPV